MIKFLIFLFLVPPLSHAEENQVLIRKIDRMKSSVSQAESRQRSIYKQVLDSEIKIKKMSEERSKVNKKMLASEADSQELAYEVREWEQKVKSQRKKITSSVAQIYRLKNPSLLTVLFSGQKASEIEKSVRFFKKISESDFKRFRSYEVSLRKAKEARQNLKREVRRLLGLRKDLKTKENRLLADQEAKSKLIQSIKSHAEKNLMLLKELRARLPELDRDAKVAIFEKRGRLFPPLKRRPTEAYGSLFDPTYRVKLLHLGWTYEDLAPATSVRAIFQGTVEFVGTLPGYGKTLILNHGDHYFSVYTHNNQLKVFQGEQVFEGQTVALSGSKLYFELRHFSNAIDPHKWISFNQPNEVAQAPAYGDSL